MDKEEEALGLALIAAIIFSGPSFKDAPIDALRLRAIKQAQLLLKDCEDAVNERQEQ